MAQKNILKMLIVTPNPQQKIPILENTTQTNENENIPFFNTNENDVGELQDDEDEDNDDEDEENDDEDEENDDEDEENDDDS